MIASLINWYRRHIHRHPAAIEYRERSKLSRIARVRREDARRSECLKKARGMVRA